MTTKKIFILVGHPNPDSLSGGIADAYEQGAKERGHEVRRLNLGSLVFDPILHKGYKEMQKLEPDLVLIQENVKWSEHIVFIFPTWWGDVPALFKGMLDRMWLPGFAYNMKKGSMFWMKRLKGRSARIIATSQTNPLALKWLFNSNFAHLRWLTLWFSGVSPVRMTRFGGVERAAPAKIEKLLAKVRKLGRKAR